MSFIPRHYESCDSMVATRIAEEAAKFGSTRLFDALHGQFMKFALKHGVTLRDAELLCMNAVKLGVGR